MEEEGEEAMRRDGGGVEVLTFDYSVENHFNAIDTISELCGEPGAGVPLDEAEIQRLSPSITFLKEWRNYTYPPRDFRFSSEAESAPGEEGVACDLNLPQFSSAAVAEKEKLHGSTTSTRSSNDFVMYVGGPVWSLDWCPRSHEGPDTKVKSEFVAIAAHPPGSSYHKIGAPLVGRGIIQIWSVLNVHQNKEEEPSGIKQPNWTTKLVKSIEPKRPRGRPRKKPVDDCTEAKKPKGRPRKKSTNEPVNMITDGLNCDDQNALALVVEDPNSSCQQGRPRKKRVDESAQVKKPKGRSREKLIDEPMNRLTDDLNLDDQDVQPLSVAYPSISRQRGRSRKKHEDDCTDVKKPKIRPRSRKKSIDEPVNKQTGELKLDDQDVELLVIEYPSSSSQLLVKGKDSADTQGQRPQKQEVRRRKTLNRAEPACTPKDGSKSRLLKLKKIAWSKSDDSVCPSLLSQNGESSTPNHQMNEAEHTCMSNDGLQSGGLKRKRSTASKSDDSVGPLAISQNCKPSAQNHQINEKSRQDVVALDFVPDHVTSDISHPTRSIPKGVALPRVMLCLAHNGKVAWDVKWKPCTASSANCLHRMGFLAVLLGNGSLEVWDVPLPHIIKTIYSVSHGEGCDPRFVKLEPIFRCSVPQSGHAKSIPLTVEWSYSRPHDYILAGCHDGTVALWKFSTSGSSGDTRPLLCFSAETGPIRAISWAPAESGEASEHVILTAGHKGLKFWDLRDPFRPLWEFRPAPSFIYSVDWVAHPSCVLLSFADGRIRLLSLVKAAYDAPVHGKPSVGPLQQGMHIFECSAFAIWSVQVSRLTGMVAYCSEDGIVSRFQLTSKAVEKDPSRNRVPHFVCGTLSEDASGLLVNTPLLNTLTSKKPPRVTGNPRYLHGLLTSLTKAEKEKDPPSSNSDNNNKELALFSSDNVPNEKSGPEEPLSELRKGKKKSSNTGKTQNGKCLEEQDTPAEEETVEAEEENNTGRLPSKLVAMHRVRWNMNRGSERWLCSGGAAGIVRCQEIVLSDIDMLVAKKR